MEASHDYRRWAFESAALDLGLRQAGRTLVDAVGREPRPVTFVTSRRLADPPSADQIRAWLDLYPSLRFKLDPTSDWTDELVADLAATGAIDSVDLKGQYEGTGVDQPAGPGALPASARRVPGRLGRGSERHRRDAADPRAARGAHHVGRADPFGRGHREPPLAAADDQHQAVALRRVKRLFDAYDYCAEHEIAAYGGGQWELGPGRGHIQYLASLFHPDTPNDVAPRRLQRARAAARIAREPARSRFRSGGLPLGRITV